MSPRKQLDVKQFSQAYKELQMLAYGLSEPFHVYKFNVEHYRTHTLFEKRVGHEVPGVVAVLCGCMGGYREGDIPCMGLCPIHISPCNSV